jgi:phosphate transport system substrate-binding protein
MKSLQRVFRVCVVLACLLCIPALFAQDSTTVPAAGSGVVLPLLSQLAQASASGVTFETNVTGSNAGLQAFCAGTTSVVGSTRIISAEEDSLCQQNGVQYMELLVGHNIATFIANPADAFVTCLTLADINTVFAPSATTITNWTQVNPSYTDEPLTIFVPASDSVTTALLDALVRGEGLRADVQVLSPGEIVTAVASTPGALGVVDLQTAQSAVGSVVVLQANTNAEDPTAACSSPDAFGVENNTYGVSQSLYLYVNRAETERLKTFLDFVVSDLSLPVITQAGFTPPSPNGYSVNQQIVAGTLEGRVFSKGNVSFSIPADLTGEVNISGSGALYSFLNGAATTLTQTHPNFKATFNVDGQAAALRRLCSGQSDAALITGTMTDEQQQACTANNVTLVSIPLGQQAVVLLGHEGDTFSQCLTREQLLTLWGAASTDTVKNWNQVNETFPDQAMTLFGITEGSDVTDLLLNQPGQPAQVVRIDTEINADPLYRAAAVANVPGALTYMTWSEYQSVLANNQARIQLVQVDGGNGCVTPSAETIADGTYPLATSYTLLIAQNRLSKPEVQGYLWTLFSDENFTPVAGLGLLGFDALSLSGIRETLQVEFTKASTVTPESTAEATVSPDATAEAPVEGTAEATSAATVEATSAATVEATTAATAEVPAATVEATAEAPVATAEATAAD